MGYLVITSIPMARSTRAIFSSIKYVKITYGRDLFIFWEKISRTPLGKTLGNEFIYVFGENLPDAFEKEVKE